jgi:hypothetical protein
MNLSDLLLRLQRIQQLWKEIQRAKPNTPEYETLMKQIRVLSAEYQALVTRLKQKSK